MRLAVGIFLQNSRSSGFCVPVMVAEEVVEAMVAVSRVCEEVCDSGGERELPPRPTSRMSGVLKDLGSAEDRVACWVL